MLVWWCMEEQDGRRRRQQIKDFNSVLTGQDKKFFAFDLFKFIQDAISLIFHYRTMYQFRTISSSTLIILDVLSIWHSITNSGLTAVNPMHQNHQDPKELDLSKPRVASYKQKWKVHQDTVYWDDIKLAQRKGLKFYQTRSNAVISTIHSQLIVSRKQLWWNLKKSLTRKCMCHLDHRRRFLTKIIGRVIWILLLHEAVKTSNESN